MGKRRCTYACETRKARKRKKERGWGKEEEEEGRRFEKH